MSYTSSLGSKKRSHLSLAGITFILIILSSLIFSACAADAGVNGNGSNNGQGNGNNGVCSGYNNCNNNGNQNPNGGQPSGGGNQNSGNNSQLNTSGGSDPTNGNGQEFTQQNTVQGPAIVEWWTGDVNGNNQAINCGTFKLPSGQSLTWTHLGHFWTYASDAAVNAVWDAHVRAYQAKSVNGLCSVGSPPS